MASSGGIMAPIAPEDRLSQRGRARIQATIPEDGDEGSTSTSNAATAGASGSAAASKDKNTMPFDINAAYARALHDQEAQHPIAAILALTDVIASSTSSTLTGLLAELEQARRELVATQSSLGVRAGCQLFERFVRDSGAGEDFGAHKRHLVAQGRSFCRHEARSCQDKIAESTIQFLSDDCVILTHSYSRAVVKALTTAHRQNKRVKVYVTEGRPQGQGMKTHQLLTKEGIPCTVVLDAAVAYILERVDIVLVGAEAVVESGGLVSSIGTSQIALLAKAMGKPFYALAESYKFLRYYPLSQRDLPMPRWRGKSVPLEFDDLEEDEVETESGEAPASRGGGAVGRPARLSRTNTTTPAQPRRTSLADSNVVVGGTSGMDDYKWEMTEEMERKNPTADITGPELIDLVITDLAGAIPPTSVSQYLVAVFAT